MKKTLLLLTTILTIAVSGAQAVGDTFASGNINYVVTKTFPDPDEVGVVDIDAANVAANIVIPASVNYLGFDFAVTSLEDGAFSAHATKGAGRKPENAIIENVTLPSTVKVFNGVHTFSGLTNLVSVNLEHVEDLGSNAFVNGSLSGHIDLASCTDMGSYAFFNCPNITSISTPVIETCDAGSLYRMDGVQEFNIPSSLNSVGTLFLGDTDGSNSLVQVQLNWDSAELAAVNFANDSKFFRNQWQPNGAEGDDFVDSTVMIYVPVGSKSAYEAHPSWGKFPSANIIEGTMPLLSTDKFEKSLGLSLYPNPTNGIVNIKNINNADAEVTVFDINGRTLLQSKDSRIDISKFTAGLYVFRVKTDGGQLVKRILKQ